MVRIRGRCRKGKRLIGKAPFGHWKTTTFTAGLRVDGLVAPFVLDGPMNGESFLVYVEKVLAPSLFEGDTVVIDNLPAHKVKGVREAIEARRWACLPAALFAGPKPHRDIFAKILCSPQCDRSCTSPDAWGQENGQFASLHHQGRANACPRSGCCP